MAHRLVALVSRFKKVCATATLSNLSHCPDTVPSVYDIAEHEARSGAQEYIVPCVADSSGSLISYEGFPRDVTKKIYRKGAFNHAEVLGVMSEESWAPAFRG